MGTELLIVLFLPFAGAFICMLFRGRSKDISAGLLSIITAILAIRVVYFCFPGSHTFLSTNLPWIESKNIFGLLIDPLSSLMLLVVTVIGALIVLYSSEYISPRNREHPVTNEKNKFYFWLFIFLGSMIGVATAPNLLQLFIFWEMTSICSWALISFYDSQRSLRAGFKALIMTHLGGIFFLIGIVILFTSTGSFDFSSISALSPTLKFIVVLLLFAGSWTKASQIPLHTWLPDAMEAPTPISAYLHAAAMVKAGVYLSLRIVSATVEIPQKLGMILSIMAFLTILLAVFMYFFQNNLKRLLAFSTITHLGYILLGASMGIFGSLKGFQGGVFHIVCHGVAKGLLFLSVGAIAYATGVKNMRELSGMGSRMPVAAVTFMVGLFAVTGVPPFSCFWSKFMMLTGALEFGGKIGIFIALIIIAESLISFGWFIYVGHRVFFGEPSPAGEKAKDAPFIISFVLIILAMLTVAAPLLTQSFLKYIPLAGVMR